MPRAAWVLAVLLAVAGASRPAFAQPGPVAPAGGPPESERLGIPPPEPTSTEAPAKARVTTNRPPPILGAPVGPARTEPTPIGSVSPVSFPETTTVPVDPPRRSAGLGAPLSSGSAIPASAVEPAARPVNTPPAADPVNDLLMKRSTLRDREHDDRSSSQFGGKIGEWLHGALGNKTDWFKSDHMFDGFISPVTNPFLFEDPRSLTEVRPIFMYQQIPGSQPDLNGGNIWFFGTQARVAFTDRLSFVINKLGGISVNPGSGSQFSGQTGFAELWLGPKYTIMRNPDRCSLLAAGLQFQIPTGNSGTFQDTGSLSLMPYATYAKNFFPDWHIGSLNTMIGTGYSISVNNQRSDYYYLSAHLDLDVGNTHKFYPLMEMNWLIYTSNGTTVPIGSEGRDLINFGGRRKGRGCSPGRSVRRYKISESAQIGAAFELPIAGPRDIFQYRFTLDFILRY